MQNILQELELDLLDGEDDVTHEQKSERLARLTEVLKRTSFRYNENLVGKKMKVLIEREDPRLNGAVAARTEGKLPVRIENVSKKSCWNLPRN